MVHYWLWRWRKVTQAKKDISLQEFQKWQSQDPHVVLSPLYVCSDVPLLWNNKLKCNKDTSTIYSALSDMVPLRTVVTFPLHWPLSSLVSPVVSHSHRLAHVHCTRPSGEDLPADSCPMLVSMVSWNPNPHHTQSNAVLRKWMVYLFSA